MTDTNQGTEAPKNPPEEAIQWNKLVEALAPQINEHVTAIIKVGNENARFIRWAGAVLLGLVITCFSGLAAYAIQAGHIDMAEKVVIALISFLSGAALFGHGKK